MNISAPSPQKIAPCLWFDTQAEEAVAFYVSLFPGSRIPHLLRATKAGFEHHGKPVGTVMAIRFELCGQPFTVLYGGPLFKLNEAMSLIVCCDTQEEIDHYWEQLGEGGDPAC
jgi:predicted 3-demethylubiquinone-9 3-methyltransferase (glyoxalase superfamily)